MKVEPYLFFNGRCEEALEFYRRAVGAEVEMTMRFDESPEPHPPGAVPAGFERKIMHASFRIGGSRVMASDGCDPQPVTISGISLALSVPTPEHAERVFAALGEGGQVQMPLTKTFFSEKFGCVADKFGVSWMVVADQA